jgi:hypothetical protein
MGKIEIDGRDLKSLRETLCEAQSLYIQAYGQRKADSARHKVNQLGKLIDQIDLLRPLGSDGKHGNLHTQFCGCFQVFGSGG